MPHIGKGFTNAAATYETPYGKLSSGWKIENQKFSMLSAKFTTHQMPLFISRCRRWCNGSVVNLLHRKNLQVVKKNYLGKTRFWKWDIYVAEHWSYRLYGYKLILSSQSVKSISVLKNKMKNYFSNLPVLFFYDAAAWTKQYHWFSNFHLYLLIGQSNMAGRGQMQKANN